MFSNKNYGVSAMAEAEAIRQSLRNPKSFAFSGSKWYQGNSNGTDIDVTYRTKHEALCDCHTLRLEYGNLYLDDDPARLANLTTLTLNCTVEVGARFYDVTFNGSTHATIDPGCRTISDPIGVEFSKGDTIYIRQHITVPTGGKFPTGYVSLFVNGEGKMSGDQTKATTFTASDVASYSPLAIYATPAESSFESVGCIGDSISLGSGHSNVSIDGHIIGNIGFMQIAAMKSGRGYVSLGVNGQQTDGFMQFKRLNRMVLLEGCKIALFNYGTNDLNASRSLDFIQANLVDMWKAAKMRGMRTYQTTIPPRTTSTDGWATTANQTPVNASTAGGANSTRGLLNAWIRQGNKYLDGVIEVSDLVESSRNSGLWKPGMTGDGIHPNNAGHALWAQEVLKVL